MAATKKARGAVAHPPIIAHPIQGSFVTTYAPLIRILPKDPDLPLQTLRLGEDFVPQAVLACFVFKPDGTHSGKIRLNFGGVSSREVQFRGTYALEHNDQLDVVEGEIRVGLIAPDGNVGLTNILHAIRLSRDELAFILMRASNSAAGNALTQGILKRVKK